MTWAYCMWAFVWCCYQLTRMRCEIRMLTRRCIVRLMSTAWLCAWSGVPHVSSIGRPAVHTVVSVTAVLRSVSSQTAVWIFPVWNAVYILLAVAVSHCWFCVFLWFCYAPCSWEPLKQILCWIPHICTYPALMCFNTVSWVTGRLSDL